MSILVAIMLGMVEGLTEFLPISSTGHLTIAEKLFGYQIGDADITAFTAIIQLGAVFATLIYFRRDIWEILSGWFKGVADASQRKTASYRMGWAVIIGSIPVGIVGFVFKDQIETSFRNLWLVGIALLLWSGVMWYADSTASEKRHEKDANWKDTFVIGLVQCLALIPGVSRSGATISAGVLKGFDRVTATRLSFFLAIPALLAAGIFQATSQSSNIAGGVGWTPTIIATITTFIVAYASIAWLLRYIAGHKFTVFIVYRTIVAVILLLLLATGALSAT